MIGWLIGGGVAWLLIALAAAVLIGRGIRLADQRAPGQAPDRIPEPAHHTYRGTHR